MKKFEKEIALREKLEQMKKYEAELYDKGISYIAGVDEVGRGPLAGPVVAAAVVLPFGFRVLGVDDSKKLSAKKREELFALIGEQLVAFGIGIIGHEIIDEINILQATKRAMKQAICEANRNLAQKAGASVQHLLTDAVHLEDVEIPQTNIIKGDSSSVSIAAASILAKVTRDKMMDKFHDKYPWYGFDKNKGYGTKAHYDGISEYGICEIHRKSFLKKIIMSD